MKLEICLNILAKNKVEFSEIQSQTLRDNIFRSFKGFHCNLTFWVCASNGMFFLSAFFLKAC